MPLPTQLPSYPVILMGHREPLTVLTRLSLLNFDHLLSTAELIRDGSERNKEELVTQSDGGMSG